MSSIYKNRDVTVSERLSWNNAGTVCSVLSSNNIDTIIPTTTVYIGSNNTPLCGIHSNSIHFEPQDVYPEYMEGNIFYDNANKTFTMMSDISNANLQIGLENWTRVSNKTSEQILNGTIVYIASGGPGIKGAIPLIEVAQANNIDKSNKTIGVVTHDINADSDGYVTTFGLVNELDLEDYTEGELIYLSPTLSGQFTNIKPIAPNNIVTIGQVIRAHKKEGVLFVNTNNGGSLLNLNDVTYNNLNHGELISYNEDTTRFENVTSTTVDNTGLTATNLRIGPNNENSLYFIGNSTVWDDIVVPLLTVNTGGANGAIVATWGSNLRALQYNTTTQNNSWPSVQYPHGWKGSRVYPHIHWCSNDANTGEAVIWNLEVTWAGIPGGQFSPTATETYTATAYSSGINVQVLTNIPEEGIDPVTFNDHASAISSLMICRLYRSPANGIVEPDHDGSNVRGLSFDVHYEVDSIGSEDVIHKTYGI